MKLKDQVCSLELAKKLKELEVKQESLWYYENGELFIWDDSGNPELEPDWDNCFSAFTIAELGEIMKGKGMGVTAYSTLGRGEWWVRGGTWDVGSQKYEGLETDKIWANALAKMLVYLLENKTIKQRKEGKE